MVRNSPIKIIYLDSAISLAGGQRSLLRILEVIDRDTVEPVVMCPASSVLRKHCERLGIRWYPLFFSSAQVNIHQRLTANLRDWIGSGLAALDIAFKARKVGAALLHANTFKCGLVGCCASLISGIPLIYHDRILKRHGIWDSVVARAATSIIAVSHAVARKHPPNIQSKIMVLYDAVSTHGIRLCRDIRRCANVGYLGRISEEKGLDLLVECIPRVVNRFRNTKFLIGGAPFTSEDLPYLDRVRSMIKSLRVEKNVEFLGNIEQTEWFFSQIRVLALPSRRDAMPNVVLEAMSAGVPVVAFKSGGAEEAISDGEDGFLVDCFDTAAFSECLVRLLSEPELARLMGERGRDKVAKYYSIESMVKKLIKHYQEVSFGPGKSNS